MASPPRRSASTRATATYNPDFPVGLASIAVMLTGEQVLQNLACAFREISIVLLQLGTGIALITRQSLAFIEQFMEPKPLPARTSRQTQTARQRLFELVRQQNIAQGWAMRVPHSKALDPQDAQAFLVAAERSFDAPCAAPARRPRLQPLKPVATTNFSELSARDAGGFTFATFAKRCLSSFCNSPSAPPARTFDTNVPPSSRTSNAR